MLPNDDRGSTHPSSLIARNAGNTFCPAYAYMLQQAPDAGIQIQKRCECVAENGDFVHPDSVMGIRTFYRDPVRLVVDSCFPLASFFSLVDSVSFLFRSMAGLLS